jgi:hypothetical protein
VLGNYRGNGGVVHATIERVNAVVSWPWELSAITCIDVFLPDGPQDLEP